MRSYFVFVDTDARHKLKSELENGRSIKNVTDVLRSDGSDFSRYETTCTHSYNTKATFNQTNCYLFDGHDIQGFEVKASLHHLKRLIEAQSTFNKDSEWMKKFFDDNGVLKKCSVGEFINSLDLGRETKSRIGEEISQLESARQERMNQCFEVQEKSCANKEDSLEDDFHSNSEALFFCSAAACYESPVYDECEFIPGYRFPNPRVPDSFPGFASGVMMACGESIQQSLPFFL